jgi:hypothetical protein
MLAAAECAFGVHSEHADGAITMEYFPATQFEHAPLPTTLLYFPGAHAEHTESMKACPAEQEQAELPTGDCALSPHNVQYSDAVAPANLPSLHSWQALDPLVLLYLPNAQAVQDPPSSS